MDLDSFYKEFKALKARVEPMLDDYEKDAASAGPEPDDGMSDELRAEVYKPLAAPAAAVASSGETAGKTEEKAKSA